MQKVEDPAFTPQNSTCIDAQWLSDGSGVVTLHSDHTVQVTSPTKHAQHNHTQRWLKHQSIMSGMVVPGTTSVLLSCRNLPLQLYILPLDPAPCDDLLSKNARSSPYLPSAKFSYNTTFHANNEGYSPLFSLISHPFVQSRFYTGTNRARIDQFDMQRKDPVRTWEPRAKRRRGVGNVSALSVCKADPSVLYAGTSQHAVFHVDQRTKDTDYVVSCPQGVAQILQSDNANYLYLIPKRFHDCDQTIKVWDLRKDDFVAELQLPKTETSNEELKMKSSKCSINTLHGLLLGSPFDSNHIYVWDRTVVESGGVNVYPMERNLPTSVIQYQNSLPDANLYTHLIETNPKDNEMTFICYTEQYEAGYKIATENKEMVNGNDSTPQSHGSLFFHL